MDGNGRASTKIQVTKQIVVPPDAETFIKVVTNNEALIRVERFSKLFINQMCLVATGVTNVRQNEKFSVLVVNVSSTQIELCPRKAIAMAYAHTVNIV